jgi:hypothetical protein
VGRALVVLTALVVSACGSRSALPGFGPDAGGADGSGNSGSGGAGASTATCTSLALESPTVFVNGDAAPRFVDPPNDPARVTLAFASIATTALRHVTFEPWPEWPPDLPPDTSFISFDDPEITTELEVAPFLAGSFAAAALVGDIVQFAPTLDTNASGTGPTLALLGIKPLFVSSRADAATVIGTLSIQRELYVQIVTEPSLVQPVPIGTIACADDDLVGGAVPFGDGWLVAHSNGIQAPPATCEPPAPATAGAPRRIDVVKLQKSSITTLRSSLALATPVRELDVAPYADGIAFAWIDGTSSAAPVLHFARYVASQNVITTPVTLTASTERPAGLTLTPFGDRWVVSYSDDGKLVTKVLAPSGNLQAALTLSTDIVGRAVVVSNPEGGAFLVASATTAGIAIQKLNCSE